MEYKIKDIFGYEGLYTIDTLGVVRGKKGIVKPFINNSGYYQIDLYKNGVRRKFLIQRLVAEAFIPNSCNWKYTDVDHIDNNRLNNKVENLQWTTHKTNMNYRKQRKNPV